MNCAIQRILNVIQRKIATIQRKNRDMLFFFQITKQLLFLYLVNRIRIFTFEINTNEVLLNSLLQSITINY